MFYPLAGMIHFASVVNRLFHADNGLLILQTDDPFEIKLRDG